MALIVQTAEELEEHTGSRLRPLWQHLGHGDSILTGPPHPTLRKNPADSTPCISYAC